MRKLILLFTIIAVHFVGAEEDFRPWQTFNGQDFDVFLKTLYKRDITAGRLIGYDPAFSVETLKLSKEQLEKTVLIINYQKSWTVCESYNYFSWVIGII